MRTRTLRQRYCYNQSYVIQEFSVRVTGVELQEEFSVYKYTLEYVTTHLLGESSENRMRLLKGYSILL